ncbi:hypothetical protein, partial [Planotetraspora sp. GP83]|uniref:hypothetical protein n=1 Tax=Planotetraspora sp. GP83 TaxID=3156264 RepID=UPI00351354E0
QPRQTDGHGHVRHPVTDWGIPPRDAGVTPDAGRGRDSGTSTPPHDHPGERHQPRQTDGHGHVRHPVTDWGIPPRDAGVTPDAGRGRDSGTTSHGREGGTTGARPPSQLRSLDDANGDPVPNPYERIERQQNHENGAQKTTAEQSRTDFHKELAGSGQQGHRSHGDTHSPSRTDFSSSLSGSADKSPASDHKPGSDSGGHR